MSTDILVRGRDLQSALDRHSLTPAIETREQHEIVRLLCDEIETMGQALDGCATRGAEVDRLAAIRIDMADQRAIAAEDALLRERSRDSGFGSSLVPACFEVFRAAVAAIVEAIREPSTAERLTRYRSAYIASGIRDEGDTEDRAHAMLAAEREPEQR